MPETSADAFEPITLDVEAALTEAAKSHPELRFVALRPAGLQAAMEAAHEQTMAKVRDKLVRALGDVLAQVSQ